MKTLIFSFIFLFTISLFAQKPFFLKKDGKLILIQKYKSFESQKGIPENLYKTLFKFKGKKFPVDTTIERIKASLNFPFFNIMKFKKVEHLAFFNPKTLKFEISKKSTFFEKRTYLVLIVFWVFVFYIFIIIFKYQKYKNPKEEDQRGFIPLFGFNILIGALIGFYPLPTNYFSTLFLGISIVFLGIVLSFFFVFFFWFKFFKVDNLKRAKRFYLFFPIPSLLISLIIYYDNFEFVIYILIGWCIVYLLASYLNPIKDSSIKVLK